MDNASFVFPAVKGIQANKEYFTAMVPLEIIPKIFQFADEELPPEIRAQRILNKSRIPEMRDYIINNPESYVFSSLTVSVDGAMLFEPINEVDPMIGHISISMSARFLINDGQHRRAAIAEAIKINPDLKHEHISVVFYHDKGLKSSQQMFSDLNRYAIRPTKSINILFNSREESSIIAKEVVKDVSVFTGLTEKEKTTVSNRSKALFTLSAISTATIELLKDVKLDMPEKTKLAIEFWNEVASIMPEWLAVMRQEKRSSEVRSGSICSLSITLVAIGHGGNKLLHTYPHDWKERIANLAKVDWKKDNPIWNDLVFVNGKVAANRSSQKALSTYIEKIMMEETGETNG
ncbi:DNA sulfur modification protein DndB [Anaerotignum lactatifermentans]|uniref:DNA sulfur modification protein DndB n=1 Tax=Anaerotignum lactatifermentans TaxID=160404 RepID=A0ABS2G9E7_9FIRM|nr:DNA sulfur modification protein DndB [Anaerotignum lactatifermentans]MBM6829705.1 DNA sulfur modification protein DndB [Anaerotignum lactatifermentans]MBM6878106.1 DNA sulfur modification protein DndB [Anaerotignum lactatifermentans]MBM6951279.1 DNA sulfur modification protein DndB [Anaerotignum lactatifermentans]